MVVEQLEFTAAGEDLGGRQGILLQHFGPSRGACDAASFLLLSGERCQQ
jgi:hypothetical protein